jgi:HSP20 family molecular chaperone IbpA
MSEDIDPFGMNSYMRNRLREFFGSSGTPGYGSFGGLPSERPRGAAQPAHLLQEVLDPLLEWLPESAMYSPTLWLPQKGPGLEEPQAQGYRKHPSGEVEILESATNRVSRPPRRLFRSDVTETEDSYIVRADLAGMSRENVKIWVEEERQLVHVEVEPPKDEFFGLYKSPLESKAAELKESKAEEIHDKPAEQQHQPESLEKASVPETLPVKEVCHLMERCTSPMSRAIKMPRQVDFSVPIDAVMHNGLLVIKFAKKRESVMETKRHEIPVK